MSLFLSHVTTRPCWRPLCTTLSSTGVCSTQQRQLQRQHWRATHRTGQQQQQQRGQQEVVQRVVWVRQRQAQEVEQQQREEQAEAEASWPHNRCVWCCLRLCFLYQPSGWRCCVVGCCWCSPLHTTTNMQLSFVITYLTHCPRNVSHTVHTGSHCTNPQQGEMPSPPQRGARERELREARDHLRDHGEGVRV